MVCLTHRPSILGLALGRAMAYESMGIGYRNMPSLASMDLETAAELDNARMARMQTPQFTDQLLYNPTLGSPSPLAALYGALQGSYRVDTATLSSQLESTASLDYSPRLVSPTEATFAGASPKHKLQWGGLAAPEKEDIIVLDEVKPRDVYILYDPSDLEHAPESGVPMQETAHFNLDEQAMQIGTPALVSYEPMQDEYVQEPPALIEETVEAKQEELASRLVHAQNELQGLEQMVALQEPEKMLMEL